MNDKMKCLYDRITKAVLFSYYLEDFISLEKENIYSKEYLEYLEDFIFGLYYDNPYTNQNMKNLEKFFNIIGENIDSELKMMYEKVFNYFNNLYVTPTNEIYNIEYLKKFSLYPFDYANGYEVINKRELDESFLYDYVVLTSFYFNEEIYKKQLYNEFLNNEKYLYAISKLLTDYPQFVNLKQHKNRILEVLINSKQYESTNMTIFRNRIIKRINDLEKGKNLFSYNLDDMRLFYQRKLLDKIIYGNGNLNELESEYIKSDMFQNLLNEHLSQLSFTCEEAKNRMKYIYSLIRDRKGTELAKIEYNEKIIELNKIEVLDTEYFYQIISLRMFKIIDIIKRINIDGKDFNIEEFVRDFISYNFNLLQIILTNPTELEEYLKQGLMYNDNVIYSLKNFLNGYPSMFLNPDITESVKKIIKSNLDIAYKNHFKCSNDIHSYKKLLKKINKVKE